MRQDIYRRERNRLVAEVWKEHGDFDFDRFADAVDFVDETLKKAQVDIKKALKLSAEIERMGKKLNSINKSGDWQASNKLGYEIKHKLVDLQNHGWGKPVQLLNDELPAAVEDALTAVDLSITY